MGDSSRMISSLSLPSDFEGSMCCGAREVKKTGGADFDVVLSAVGLEKRPSWGRTLLRSAAESTPALQLALPLLLLPSAPPAGAGGKSSLGFSKHTTKLSWWSFNWIIPFDIFQKLHMMWYLKHLIPWHPEKISLAIRDTKIKLRNLFKGGPRGWTCEIPFLHIS